LEDTGLDADGDAVAGHVLDKEGDEARAVDVDEERAVDKTMCLDFYA